MLKKTSALVLLAASVSTGCIAMAEKIQELPSGKYLIDPTHASVTWKVMHMGLAKYTARFTDVKASIDLDTKDPVKSKVVAKINPTSIETDYPFPEKNDFDKELVEHENWFNSNAFPSIDFTSGKIEKTGKNTGVMMGNMTFLGVTKPVSINVTYNGGMAKHPFAQKPAIGFSAVGKLNRSDWGQTAGTPYVADDVEFIIEAEFIKE